MYKMDDIEVYAEMVVRLKLIEELYIHISQQLQCVPLCGSRHARHTCVWESREGHAQNGGEPSTFSREQGERCLAEEKHQ